MRKTILSAMLLSALAAPALADNYPVNGRWGVSKSLAAGAMDCGSKRVIDFGGNQRTDNQGGVPAYRNKSVTSSGPSHYRIVDVFSNGQINNAQVIYTLNLFDADHIQMNMQSGGTLKLQRCQ